jgi:hypothetical protein
LPELARGARQTFSLLPVYSGPVRATDSKPQWEIGWLKFKKLILPDSVFSFLIRESIPQLRKSHTREPLVTCQFSGTCLQSQDIVENLALFWLWKGQFRKQISRVLFGFCSAYIYSFERFFGQLPSDVYEYFVTFVVFELEERMPKNL